MDVRPALAVLSEALGEPRRLLETLDETRTVASTAAWDCGCRVQTGATELRSWDSCGEHGGFRDAVMTQLAISASHHH